MSFLGSTVTYVALPYQVYTLTGSSLAVGMLGVVELLPLLVTAFAAVWGVQTSVVSGGVLCVAAVLVCGARLPRFRAYDARPAP